ncbi:cob(I)yrinic acid a,c-diamide adenosyltransferase [Candidatus Berkelbacteria bacterium]|nr:cob(I)yrinic acid a,c-diamide adenosyltransferase [Candidatus Berkelbacteria bacterium]
MGHLYTKTGDTGTTGILGGERVSKADYRIDALGALDEANAALGWAISTLNDQNASSLIINFKEELIRIQHELFELGAALASPFPIKPLCTRAERINELETLIDQYHGNAPSIQAFILPGGGATGAALHLARTIIRRAERRLVILQSVFSIETSILTFVNRLSDLLFASARWINAYQDVPEHVWQTKSSTDV